MNNILSSLDVTSLIRPYVPLGENINMNVLYIKLNCIIADLKKIICKIVDFAVPAE